jgi:hypothetical protein
MKKATMTLIGVAFMSMMALAQSDSTGNLRESPEFNDTQDPALNQSTNPLYWDSIQRNQSPASPIVQPLPQQQTPQIQSQPQLESQPQIQSQPSLPSQPLQPQPQVPTERQPVLDRNEPQQNQLNESLQPIQPTQPSLTPPRTDPTGSGATTPR